MSSETKAQFDAMHKILQEDPRRYVEIMTEKIENHGNNQHAYFGRHQGWCHLGEFDRAIDDLDMSINLSPHYMDYLSRGEIYARLGQYREALQDFDTAESMAGDTKWVNCWGPLHQADCHSRLGNEQEALAACERLKDDHWTPGLHDTPAGSKQEVIEEVRRRIASLKG